MEVNALITYSIITEQNNGSECGEYTSYGIDVSDGERRFTIHDVFFDKREALKCIGLFNSEQLEIIHLEQVLDEILRYGL